MQRLNISAVAINEDTLQKARRTGVDLWQLTRLACMLFISPEILASAGFAALLAEHSVRDRIVLSCVDEAHLILQWSQHGFRRAFLHIGQLLSRLCPKARICALSATVLPGPVEKAICKALGLFWDDIVIKRRSNLRANVQFERRLFKSALSGRSFSELDWIVGNLHTAIIYVDSIRTGWRVAGYIARLLPGLTAEERRRRVRLYNALNTSAHNEHTRQLLHRGGGTVAIATSSLCVGFSASGVDVVVMLQATSLDDVIQKGGRANRASSSASIGKAVLYSTAATYKAAQKLVTAASGPDETSATRRSSKKAAMDPDLARFIAGPCAEAALNSAYQNPAQQPCYCATCNGRPISGSPRPCACDGCQTRNCQTVGSPPSAPFAAGPNARKRTGSRPSPISKETLADILGLLRTLRESWYLDAPVEDVGHLPECAMFPQELMHLVATRVLELDTPDKIRAVASDCEFVVERADELAAHLDVVRHELSRQHRRPTRPAVRAVTEDEAVSSTASSDCGETSCDESGDPQPASSGHDTRRQPLADIGNTARTSLPTPLPSTTRNPRKRPRVPSETDAENGTIAQQPRPRRTAVSRPVLHYYF